MNYQYLLRQIYSTKESESIKSTIIENPYDLDSREQKYVNSSYDLSVLNTSIPAQEIVEMVQNAIVNDRKSQGKEKGIRILFYGLSAAVKTNFAHFIAESLGKGIITKNASDILGMFVGESEKNIAIAFEEAKKQKKILLFDEVDSFFRERSYASQSWKITQDYIRDKNDTITFIEEKTCLILYNGTKYPDLVCIFLEDAEKIEKKGNRTISEYITYIWENNRREQSKEKVLQSKSIFCENANSSLYDTSFGVQIPVISIKDFE